MRATREGGFCESSCAMGSEDAGGADAAGGGAEVLSCALRAGETRNKNPAKDRNEASMRLPVSMDFITVPLKEPKVSIWVQRPVYHYGPSRSPRGRTPGREKSCSWKKGDSGRTASTRTKGNMPAICTLEQAKS